MSYLFLEHVQSWRVFRHPFVSMRFDFFRCEDVTVGKELFHELVAIINPEVSVVVEAADRIQNIQM